MTAAHCIPSTVTYSGNTISITPSASQMSVVVGGYTKSTFGTSPSVYMSVSAYSKVKDGL